MGSPSSLCYDALTRNFLVLSFDVFNLLRATKVKARYEYASIHAHKLNATYVIFTIEHEYLC